MKHLLLLLFCGTVAFGETLAFPEEKIPIQPLVLPEIPTVELIRPERALRHGSANGGVSESVTKAIEPEDGVLLEWKTAIIYQRKKAGEKSLVLRTKKAALVKVIDIDTRRLEALLWLDHHGSIKLEYLPASRYRVVFVQDVRVDGDDRLIPGWFGEVEEEIDLVRSRGKVIVELSVDSQTHRVVPSNFAEWARFNPPR